MRRAESPDPTADTLAVLTRLRSGWRPSRCELADAAVLEQWRLHTPGPYLLQGWIGTNLKSGIAFAFDPAAGWARLIDRWVKLGAPAPMTQPLPSNDSVMRCAMIALAWSDFAAGRDADDHAALGRIALSLSPIRRRRCISS